MSTFNICSELQRKGIVICRGKAREIAGVEDKILPLELGFYKSKDGRYWRIDISGQIVPLHARLGTIVFGLEVDQGQEWIFIKKAP